MACSQIKVATSVLLVLCWVYGGLGEVVVLQATRQVDLRTSVVTLGESVKLKNSGSSAVNHVIICAPEAWAERRAYLEVKEGGGGRDLQLAGSAPAQEGFACERVELLHELGPGADATVDVLSRFTKVLSPLPATIPQNGQQLLLFEHTKLLASPYAVKSQSCSLLMPSPNNVKDYTKDSTTGRREAIISYGPYSDTPAFHSSPLRVHFESDDPCFQITSLQREIQVSHWGRIFVEESYRVRHGGAKHSGAWSRLDFLRPGSSTSAALNVMPMVLPLSTQWPYYKDEIGNVSTSRVRREPRRVVAELMPRFPLFGGWQINFVWGYSLPLRGFLFSPAPGMRQLQTDLSTSLQLEYAIDNLTVKVVLPEGSNNIRASIASAKPYTERREVKYTYLDTVGRPVVVLQLANLVRQDNVQLLVDYSFQPVWMLHEPGLLVGAFLMLFLALIGALRLELTISRDQRWQLVQDRERCRDMLQKAVGLFAARRKVVLDWDNQYHVLGYAAQGPRPIPRSDDKAPGLLREGGRQLEQAAAEIRSLIKDIKAVSATQAVQVQELLEKDLAFSERVTKQMQQLTSSKPPPPAQLMAEEEALSEMFKEVQKLRDSLVSVAY